MAMMLMWKPLIVEFGQWSLSLKEKSKRENRGKMYKHWDVGKVARECGLFHYFSESCNELARH